MSIYGDRAYAAFFKGYNCCQSVAVAFAEEMGMTEKQALQISAGFGGGFGRMREVCGAFSGITLVLGALYGSDDPAKKTALYTDVQALAAEYKARNGGPNTLICRELLGLKQAELRLVPGMRADIIPLLAPHYRALVLESFGVGGLPGGEQGEMFAELRRWCDSGRLAVFTTQVPHEGCDLAVYEVGRAVGELPGVLEAHDMTPEAVAVKLMWALGQTQDRAEVMRRFETPVEVDII